jgi:ParB family chromosome partitioning protein
LTMERYEIHPACALFPMMDADALEKLAEDIRAHGLRHPVILHDGKVLDGRNRLEACGRAGVAPDFEEWAGDGDPVEWVVSTNLHRRHLSTSQRAMVATRLANMRQGERTDLAQKTARLNQPAAAKMLGVSRGAVQQAAKVESKGTQALVSKVDDGTLPVSTASEAADMPEAAQDRLVEAVTNAKTPQEARKAAREILKAEKKVHVSHNSGENEWYTPAVYIKAAVEAMGGIDTDPASSEIANKTVGAGVYYTEEQDGTSQKWSGRVWMNPPYSQPQIARFAEAVSSKIDDCEIEQACVLVNNATETAWFQRMLASCSAICFPKSRIKFLDPHGKPSGAPLQGQAIIYMGPDAQSFRAAFECFGPVLVP